MQISSDEIDLELMFCEVIKHELCLKLAAKDGHEFLPYRPEAILPHNDNFKEECLMSIEIKCSCCGIISEQKFSAMSCCSYISNLRDLTYFGKTLDEYDFRCSFCKWNLIFSKPTLDTVCKMNNDEFIHTWLYPNKYTGELNKKSIFVLRERASYCEDKLANAIGLMDYKDFLTTPYWRVVSNHVKMSSNFSCEKCGSGKNLVAHHKNYKNHGYEHLHWNTDLECLCSDCHKLEHQKTIA